MTPDKTYAQAKERLLTGLAAAGWTVKKDLKIPHATSPNGDIRLWFKPQAIWQSGGVIHDLAHARSIFVDPRGTNVKGLIEFAERR